MRGEPRIVVSGVGLLSCCGDDPAAVLDAVVDGRSGVTPFEGTRTRLAVESVGVIRDFDLAHHYPVASFRRLMSRESALATVASKRALEDARLRPHETIPRHEIGLYAATGATALEFDHIRRMVDSSVGEDGSFDERKFATEGLARINPLLSFRILPNMPPCFLSIVHGIEGDNMIFNPWEGCGAQALAEGFHSLLHGHCRAALVGASDVKTHEQAFVFLAQTGLLGDDRSPPLAAAPAEGAAYLVLEEHDEALRRLDGRRPMVRLRRVVEGSDSRAGWGRTSRWQTLGELFRQALETTGQPDLVILSACGDWRSDEAEACAVDQALGDTVQTLSPKLALGDTFAAAGIIGAVLGCAAIEAGMAQRVHVSMFGNGRPRGVAVLEAIV